MMNIPLLEQGASMQNISPVTEQSEWTETPTSFVRLRDDGIFEVRCKDGAVETLETARQNLAIGAEMLGDQRPVPFLQIWGKLLKVTPEAQDFYAESDKVRQLFTKCAFVSESFVSRVLGNLFIGLKKPKVPAKLFNSKAKAIAWLNECK